MKRVKAKRLNNLPKNIFIGEFHSLLKEILWYIEIKERVIFDMSGVIFPKLTMKEWLEMWKPLRITQDLTYGEYPANRREGSGSYLPPLGIDFEALNIVPIFRKTVFEGDANFSSVKFPDFTDFSLTLFKGRACFRMAKFGDMSTFKGAIFADEANFTWAHFGFNVNMQRIKFMGNRITFERASFEDKASFYKSIVFVPIYFWDVHNLFSCEKNKDRRNTSDGCSEYIKIANIINEIKNNNEQMMEISFKDAIFGKGLDMSEFTIFFFGRYQLEDKLQMFQEGKSFDISLAKGFISEKKKESLNIDLEEILSDLLFIATTESEDPNVLEKEVLIKDGIYLEEEDGNEKKDNKFYFVLWVPDVNISFQGVQKEDDFLIELGVVCNMNNGLLNAGLLPSIIVLDKKKIANARDDIKKRKERIEICIKKYKKCITSNLESLQRKQDCWKVLKHYNKYLQKCKENTKSCRTQFFEIIKIIGTKAMSEIEEDATLKIVSLDFMDSILKHGKLTVKAYYYNKSPCVNNDTQKLQEDIERYSNEIVKVESKDRDTEMDINKFSDKIRIKLSIYNSTIRDYVVVGGLIHDLLIEKNIIMAPLEIKPLKGEGQT